MIEENDFFPKSKMAEPLEPRRSAEAPPADHPEAVAAELTQSADRDIYETNQYLLEALARLKTGQANEPGDLESLEALQRETQELEEAWQSSNAKILAVRKRALESATETVVSGSDQEMIKQFDKDLKPLRPLHHGFNRVFLCQHPEYGLVVVKTPSDPEEIKLIKKATAANVPNIARHLKSADDCLMTEYIEGGTVANILSGENGWEMRGDQIIFEGNLISTKQKVQEKLTAAVDQLHALKRAGFDIRAINVKISTADGEPYLFDFDLFFGGLRDEHIDSLLEELIESPHRTLSLTAGKVIEKIENIIGKIVGLPLMTSLLLLETLTEGPKESWAEFKQGVGEYFGGLSGQRELSPEKKYEKELSDFQEDDHQDIKELFSSRGSVSLTHRLLLLKPDDKHWSL
jgi:hypothetical protein